MTGLERKILFLDVVGHHDPFAHTGILRQRLGGVLTRPGVADTLAETDLEGLEPARRHLPNHLCSAVVSGNEYADADVVVGIHGEA